MVVEKKKAKQLSQKIWTLILKAVVWSVISSATLAESHALCEL